jgi:hypothetical protein
MALAKYKLTQSRSSVDNRRDRSQEIRTLQDSCLTENLTKSITTSSILNSKIMKEKTKRKKFEKLYLGIKHQYKLLQIKYRELKTSPAAPITPLLSDRPKLESSMRVSDFQNTKRSDLLDSVYGDELIDMLEDMEASF